MKLPNIKSPFDLMSEYVSAPLSKMQREGSKLMYKSCEKIANFIFDKSKETALIMLLFNALGIYSSHTAQIHGLEKSNRENKDFLIDQEVKERKIDLFLTVIPPWILKNYISKKLEKGHWTTASAREKLIRGVAPSVGATQDDLYHSSNVPVKKTVRGMLTDTIDLFAENRNKFPRSVGVPMSNLQDISNNIKSNTPDKIPLPTLDAIAHKFDDRLREYKIKPTNRVLKTLRNSSAYDELSGLNNGIVILATMAYTIVATNIIMPYLKNKFSNQEYERGLKEKGETRESMRRKRRFEYNEMSEKSKTGKVFDTFSGTKNQTPNLALNNSKQTLQIKKENPFDNFTQYNIYKNPQLKI